MANLKKLKEATKKIAQAQKDYQRACKAAATETKLVIKDLFKEYFDSIGKEVKTVCWTQYTPYYCDGDTCTFGINDMYFSTVVREQSFYDDDEEEEGEIIFSPSDSFEETVKWNAEYAEKYPQYGPTTVVNISEDAWNKSNQLVKAISQINEEIMEEIFGDHVAVIVTKKGIDVQEFEHD